jgi:hypothetical protein
VSDTLSTLGTILTEDQPRDAVHVAVLCCVAYRTLRPGQHIGFHEPGVCDSLADKLVGVADPFLKRPILPGEKFWLFLYPNTVTGMTHHWQHPEIPNGN